MYAPLRFVLVAILAASIPTIAAPLPALANYSCEPGQPNCTPNGSGNKGAPSITPWPQIACRVAGKPEAQPDDLRFTNVGDVVIAGGTTVYWRLKQTGEHGEFVLLRDLVPGGDIDDPDVLKKGLPPNTRCLTRIP